jgi:hypothetical protein
MEHRQLKSPKSSASSFPPCFKVLGFNFRSVLSVSISGKVFGFMEKKIFWLLFTVLGVVMGIFLPLWWNLALTLPLLVLCWWVVYRSGWLS